ncbi:MAG: hypothetical protein ACI8TX_001856 [Hyphomicrobiaceae bacterium]|jgi:hypothetical protein
MPLSSLSQAATLDRPGERKYNQRSMNFSRTMSLRPVSLRPAAKKWLHCFQVSEAGG